MFKLLFCIVALVAIACSSGPNPRDTFVGTWTYKAGGGTYTCDDNSAGTLTINVGARVIFKSVESNDSNLTAMFGQCPIVLTVEDSVATVIGNCVVNSEDGGESEVITLVPTKWEFRLVTDNHFEETAVQAYNFTKEFGSQLNCTVMYSAQATKE